MPVDAGRPPAAVRMVVGGAAALGVASVRSGDPIRPDGETGCALQPSVAIENNVTIAAANALGIIYNLLFYARAHSSLLSSLARKSPARARLIFVMWKNRVVFWAALGLLAVSPAAFAQAAQRVFVGGLVGVSTLSADGRAVTTPGTA